MTVGQFQPPSSLEPTALIHSADHAVNNALPGGPSCETVHRAISTAYHAVFHAIDASNAIVHHGVPTNAADARAWTDTYRRMHHNLAARSLSQHLFSLPHNAQLLANHFINLKTAREIAEYDPNRVLTTDDAKYWMNQARSALIALQAMLPTDRQTFRNITRTGSS